MHGKILRYLQLFERGQHQDAAEAAIRPLLHRQLAVLGRDQQADIGDNVGGGQPDQQHQERSGAGQVDLQLHGQGHAVEERSGHLFHHEPHLPKAG